MTIDALDLEWQLDQAGENPIAVLWLYRLRMAKTDEQRQAIADEFAASMQKIVAALKRIYQAFVNAGLLSDDAQP